MKNGFSDSRWNAALLIFMVALCKLGFYNARINISVTEKWNFPSVCGGSFVSNFDKLPESYTPTNALFIHLFSILSDDRSKASSKTIPPHSAI